MGANSEVIVFPPGNSGKILKWKVKEGTFVPVGRVLLLYDAKLSCGQEEPKKLKATQMGMVRKLLAREGETIQPGTALLELEECSHPTVMNAMCAECGADLRTENQTCLKASVPMVHSIPELKVSREQAETIGKADEERLLKHRKLVLLVDLDQTLIHTTNDNIPPNIKDVYHFQLYGPASPWYHTRIRPGTKNFLKEMSQLYELHICTFGARNYAHMIAMFLDQDGKYFSHRILSRDECFNSSSKTANLTALFPCGDNLVCIIDDREDVWNFAPNLIHVKPYHFFKHTGDINAPPGLTKHENDEKEGFDFRNIGNKGRVCPEKKADEKKVAECEERKEKYEEGSPELNKQNTETLSAEVITENGNGEHVTESETIKDVTVHEENREKPVEAKMESIDSDFPKEKGTEESPMDCCPSEGEVEKTTVNVEVKDDTSLDVPMDSSPTETEDKQCSVKVDVASSVKEKDISGNSPMDTCPPETEDKQCSTNVEVESLVKEETSSGNFPMDSKPALVENERSSVNFGKAEGMPSGDKQLDVEDSDDYLMYLEGILRTIHSAFYQMYDDLKGDIPDLKNVIPYVRRKVLAGTRLVFSGLVPTHVPLESSRVYQVARSLGAVVSADIDAKTTHLVAVRPGTAKVITARRMKNMAIVTPEWLWCCAERWERVEEMLFPLGRGNMSRRHPPPHCGSPEHTPGQHSPGGTPRFIDSINPLMSFSSEEIANMDREVEDIFNETESEGDGEDTEPENDEEEDEEERVRRAVLDYESSSSSADSLSGGEKPHGWGAVEAKERRKRNAAEAEFDDLDEDMPSTKFRRGEALPSDLELGEDESASNGSEEPPDEIDDGDWNMMGAALEREFLSGNPE